MRFRLYVWALLMAALSSPITAVWLGTAKGDDQKYIMRLADIMSVAQLRHMKLWLAGESSNWELAAYELRQFRESLIEAAYLYPGIPVSNVTTMAIPIQAVADAIEAKDRRAFTSNFGSLTAECNNCHQSMDRSYIVIRVPTASPFSNQVFSVRSKP